MEKDGWSYHKVPITGRGGDEVLVSMCVDMEMVTMCSGPDGCGYNDDRCVVTSLSTSCSNPMLGIARQFGCTNPSRCDQLENTFTYMAGNGYDGCGSRGGSWCVQGSSIVDGYGICVMSGSNSTYFCFVDVFGKNQHYLSLFYI